MQPTKEILAVLDWLQARTENAAMATVVRTGGSTYRKIGARLGISHDGETHGAVSAGCLEQDVQEAASQVIRTGLPRLLHYDNTAEEDIIWGLGLGCNGVVDILVQPFAEVRSVYAAAAEALRQGKPAVVSTLIESPKECPLATGSAISTVEGRTTSSAPVGPPGFPDDQLRCGPAGVIEDEAGGVWCVEQLEPQRKLVILGADPDSIPLAELASKAGFHVTVVDHRASHADAARYPLADRMVLCRPPEFSQHVELDSATLVVVKTHNYLLDQEFLQILLPSPVSYIGQMGPRSRMERLLEDLAKDGVKPTTNQLSRLHAPVGLDLNAETAEQVALSIVAEMTAAVGGRTGGELRSQEQDIHPRS